MRIDHQTTGVSPPSNVRRPGLGLTAICTLGAALPASAIAHDVETAVAVSLLDTSRSSVHRQAFDDHFVVRERSWLLVEQEPPSRAASSAGTPPAQADGEQVVHSFLRTLDEQPVEAGMTHPAEDLLREAVAVDPIVVSHCMSQLRGNSLADFVRILSRVEAVPGGVRDDLVSTALNSDIVAVRQAGVEAVENWEDPALLEILRSHSDAVSWLQEYADEVLDDLGG